MSIKDTWKHKLSKYPHTQKKVKYFYNVLYHRERLMKKKRYGQKNKGKTIYLIRPSSEDCVQGLMSLYLQTLRKIDYALRKGYVPYIDFKNYKTQYYDGQNNIWQFYFTQPSSLSLQEVYQSTCVLLSGVSLEQTEDEELFKESIFFDKTLCRRGHEITKIIELSSEAKDIVQKEADTIQIENCIGVYLRGTDYTKLKPIGEHVQPSIEMVIEKMQKFVDKDLDVRFFLVTEDMDIYTAINKAFSDRVYTVSFDSFIENYNGESFLSASGLLDNNKKTRGMNYLVKIVLLSRCKSLISSITMGSIAAYAMNGGKYENKVIFNLGLYQ